MKEKFGISGSTLKLLAIVSMFIDHTGATVVMRILNTYPYSTLSPSGFYGLFSYQQWLTIYHVMRGIGRIAFPIFCFLLVEGFLHTHNVKKYAVRLLLFCFVSEIPFDLAFNNAILEFQSQNVFFTLFFGLLVMIGIQAALKRTDWQPLFRWLLSLLVLFAGMAAAALLSTDYSYIGVFCIAMLYLTFSRKASQLLVGCVEFWWELPAPLAFLPIAFYNGKRGWNLKYFFYLFYPLHLLLLVLVCYLLGIL